MCMVSVVMDYGWERLRDWQQPIVRPDPFVVQPIVIHPDAPTITKPAPSEGLAEFIRTLEDMLERAKEYDRRNNEPDCELDEKRAALKKIADEMGVQIRFPAGASSGAEAKERA